MFSDQQVSYLIVDEMHAEHPELIRDQYWDDVLPDELPHTVASQPLGHHSPYMGSTAHIAIPAQQTEIFNGSATPQLHKLDEVSEASTSLDDDDIPSDGGESGYLFIHYLCESCYLIWGINWSQDYHQAESTETATETTNFSAIRGDQFVSSVAQTIYHFRHPESFQQRRSQW